MTDSIYDNKFVSNFKGIRKFDIDKDSIKILPINFCLKNSVVILGKVDPNKRDSIQLGMINIQNDELKEAIRQKFGREVIPVQMTKADLAIAIKEGFGAQAFQVKQEEVPKKTSAVLSEQNIIQMVDNILTEAVKKKASDIHIECYQESVSLRFRIDGVLYQIPSPINSDNVNQVVSRLKIMANLDIAERRIPQDGRIDHIVSGGNVSRVVTLRVAICPGPYGEDVVMRILDKQAAQIGLERLGFNEKAIASFYNLIHNPEGFIIVTGPTGSGKTTTLYSALYEITSPYKKVLSAEDPIEYTLEGINQKQVSKQVSFAMLAREFLRQDPDVILIGEIRDEETAATAIQAAQTGHLVFSTLHTLDSTRAISRLKTLGIAPNLIASSVLGILAQRLVRTICNNCRVEYTPENNYVSVIPAEYRPEKFVKGRGCMECRNLGFRGQTGIYELFLMDDEMEEMINKESPDIEVRQRAIKKGMEVLLEDALLKVKNNITTVEEIFDTITFRQIVSQIPDLKLVKAKQTHL